MIHQYKLDGYNIVLDICSGSVHAVDELAYDIITMFETESRDMIIRELTEKYRSTEGVTPEEVGECYDQIAQLKAAGKLFTEDTFQPMAGDLKAKTAGVVKALCLHIAHTCNLNCSYCFASQGKYHGDRALMSYEVGKQALDFLMDHSGTRHNLEVDFFGGEPLMNFDVVKQVVEYARSVEKEHNKNFRFTITTNGVLLDDDSIDFINREMSNVVLSLDGRKEVNDRLRPTVNKKGSYDIIVPKYQKLVEARGDKEYYVRGTFTKYNLDFADDVMHLNELGFDQISVEPVVTDPELPYALTEKDLPAIAEEYEKLSKLLIERKKNGTGFNFFHFMIDLDQGPCAIKRLRGCSCGNEYVAVTPEGDIYPCHQFVGMDEWKMGSVLDDSVNIEMKKMFSKANIYSKEECADCWAKFYCSGGCNANNMQYNNTIFKPHKLSCALEQKRLECAIMIKAALADE